MGTVEGRGPLDVGGDALWQRYLDGESDRARRRALAALVMSVVPAHIMRSVGGGYDNESVAMTAMVMAGERRNMVQTVTGETGDCR